MFFAVKNHTSHTVRPCPEPWAFQPTEVLSDELRHNKAVRQAWYRDPKTEHCFYSGLEAVNPNLRVSKENPPHAIHGFVADYEVPVDDARVEAAMANATIRPSWVCRSLGGGRHAVWLLQKPIVVAGDWKLAVELLEKAKHWLGVDILPGMDAPAFVSPGRYYCNGCNWKTTNAEAIPAEASQAFLVKVANGMRRAPSKSSDIPIEVLEAALRDRYPNFQWPEAFAFDTQGPSFWVPGSTSAKSAIVKQDGMFTFAAHADKPFYTWADLLGSDFVKRYQEKRISDLTSGVFFDGQKYWRKVSGIWRGCSKAEMEVEFRCAGMGGRAEGGAASQMDKCFQFIHNQQRVSSVGPHVLYPEGLLRTHGGLVLNTSQCAIIKPAEGRFTWGVDFGFLAQLLDHLFDPSNQLPHFLAWWKYFYEGALRQQPEPGQNVFAMGGTGIGKTFLGREVLGAAFGGAIDASKWLLEGATFNSEFLERAILCVDDDTVSEDQRKQQRFATACKKLSANDSHHYNRKFEAGGVVRWTGRVFCTSNLDSVSSQILGPMDQSIKDKTSLFRCAKEPGFVFPERDEIRRRTSEELPRFLRWLLDWSPPAEVKTDRRFGVAAYHNESLLSMSLQNSPASLVKEILLQVFAGYFELTPEATVWTGSLHNLITLVTSTNPVAGELFRKISHAAIIRYLALIEKEGALRVDTAIGKHNVKLFTFHKSDYI